MSTEGERRRAWAEEQGVDLFFDGPGDMDTALVGVASQGPIGPNALYDEELLIKALAEAFSPDEDEEDDRSEDDIALDVETSAREWLSYNTAGAYVGEKTPFIIARFIPEEPDADAQHPE